MQCKLCISRIGRLRLAAVYAQPRAAEFLVLMGIDKTENSYIRKYVRKICTYLLPAYQVPGICRTGGTYMYVRAYVYRLKCS